MNNAKIIKDIAGGVAHTANAISSELDYYEYVISDESQFAQAVREHIQTLKTLAEALADAVRSSSKVTNG